MHERLVAEPHLGLRRVHVHVHGVGRHLDEHVRLGAPLAGRRRRVGVDHGVRHGPVLDDAAVDEELLRAPRRPLLGEGRDEPVDAEASGLLGHRHEVGAIAVQLVEAIRQRGGRRAAEEHARPARHGEPDLGVAQRELRRHAGDLRRLGRVRLQELAPGREVVEEVGHLDDRAGRHADLGHRGYGAAVDAHLGPGDSFSPAGPQHEVRHGRDARQRLAAEAHRADGLEVLGPRDLAGGMPLQREARVGGIHPLAVVLDADERLAAHLDRHADARRAGVDGVLDELLHDRRGTLDDFARGDLVGQFG